MAKSIFNLTLDIHNPAPQCSVSVKLGDTGRRLSVRFVENGKPIVLAPGTFVMFVAKKPDGTEVYGDCTCDLVGGSVIYDVDEQVTTALGIVRCQFQIFGPDGGAIASPTMEMVVRETFFNENVAVSKSDYGGIAAWWGTVNDMNAARELDISNLGARHDTELGELRDATVKYTDVVNALDSDEEQKPLSASMGKELKSELDTENQERIEKDTKIESSVITHGGRLDGHDSTLKQHRADLDSVTSLANELKANKLNASVYHGEIPKMKADVETLKTDVQTNNQTRQDQYVELTEKIATLQALLDGEDLNLDQISEIVEYIKSNRQEIDQWAGRYVSKLDIADNLLISDSSKVLSARAGNELYSMLVATRALYYALNARVPEISDEDEGKIAVVVNGAWAAVSMTDVSEVAM